MGEEIRPRGMRAMREIIERYEGMTTPQGHAIRVDRRPNEVVLWSLHRGELDGVHGRHRMGIARVEKQADVYLVGWLRGTEEGAYENYSYWDLDEVFGSLDRVIASR
jgi:hypothetical protein